MDHDPNGHQRNILPLPEELPFAQGKHRRLGLQVDAQAGPPGIAHGGGPGMVQAGFDHMLELIFILGGHHHHVGHVSEVRKIKGAMMGRPIFRDQAPTINAKRHW